MKKILSCVTLFALLLSIPAMAVSAEENGLWIGDYTLTYWIPIDYSSAQVYDSYADHPFFKWMEEKTGVHITFIHPSEEQMDQQFNLMVSSGKYYDMMFNAGSDMINREEMLNAGVWADIYEFEDIMPNYFRCLRCSDGSCYAWEWGPEKAFIGTAPQPEWETGCVTESGRLWCVTQTNCDEWPTEAGALIRQDWLDEFGLAVPQTIEELETVLEAFRSKGDDIIPMTLAQDGCNCTTGYLCSAFDIRPCWMTQDNGLIKQVGWAREEGREYLTLLRDWYQKGYIDPDFMNRDGDACISLLLNDRLGILCESWYEPTALEDMYEGSDEDFKLTAIPLVRKTKDQTLRYKLYYASEPYNYTCICGLNENKEIAAMWLDKLFTDEAYLRANYGVENESFILDENGVPYYTEWFYEHMFSDELNYRYLMPSLTYCTSARAVLFYNGTPMTVEEQKTVANSYSETCAIWGSNANHSMLIGDQKYEEGGWNEMNDLFTEGWTYLLPNMLKIITGQEDIANYDTIIEHSLDIGLREARDLVQKCFNRQHGQDMSFGIE